MKLISTRDPSREGRSYAEVLLAGLAPDGGLYVPESYPQLSIQDLRALKGLAYTEVAFAVKKRLVGDSIPESTLKSLIMQAFSSHVFDAEDGNVTPVSKIGEGLYLQNLSLGPTASFKDMALQLLSREMEQQLEARDEKLFILGATSGDTGSAAEAGVKGLARIKLCMLSPEKGMSDFQKAQMGELSGGNIFNISIRGRFDDCQDLVKAVKRDPAFADLGAVNSINWGRISAQVAYYVSGYLQVASDIGEPIDFCVPSGNFGNAFSGYVAKRMGLPIRRIIIATNENDVLDRLFKTGVYEARGAQVTSSPSMDISKASNYERLFFDVSGNDAETTAAYMDAFSKNGTVDMRDFGLDTSAFAERGFVSASSTHADRIATIKQTYESSGQIIDPHTADAVFVGSHMKTDVPLVCLETALPVKFEETIKEALGFVPPRPPRFADLQEDGEPAGFSVLDTDVETLKGFLRNVA
jgi:threonine synthase